MNWYKLAQIGGEYWIDSSGNAMFADADIGDMNHEAYVIDMVRGSYMDNDMQDWDEWKQEQAQEKFQEYIDAADTEEEKIKLQVKWNEDNGESFMLEMLRELGMSDEEYQVAEMRHPDIRLFSMQNWGWKRLMGSDVETWTLTAEDVKNISSGLWDAYDERVEDETFDVYVMSTQKWYKNVPWSVFDSEDPVLFREYDSHLVAKNNNWFKKAQTDKGYWVNDFGASRPDPEIDAFKPPTEYLDVGHNYRTSPEEKVLLWVYCPEKNELSIEESSGYEETHSAIFKDKYKNLGGCYSGRYDSLKNQISITPPLGKVSKVPSSLINLLLSKLNKDASVYVFDQNSGSLSYVAKNNNWFQKISQNIEYPGQMQDIDPNDPRSQTRYLGIGHPNREEVYESNEIVAWSYNIRSNNLITQRVSGHYDGHGFEELEFASNNAYNGRYDSMSDKITVVPSSINYNDRVPLDLIRKLKKEFSQTALIYIYDYITNRVRKIASQQKIMYIMRGISGSGKSTKAKQLVGNGQTFSTDDFFMVKGEYQYDPDMVSDAHSWNKWRVEEAIGKGISPIVVDNTNVEAWEAQPYVRPALKAGYNIRIIEPDTPWAFNAEELAKRNSHGVPKDVIEGMIEKWDKDMTVDSILSAKKENALV